MKLSVNDTAAVFIDFQERLVPAMDLGAQVTARSALLMRGLTALGVPFILTRQYPKGLGDTVPEVRDAAGDAPVFDKLCFSLCDEAEILAAVAAMGRKNIVVCGMEAHICVLQTVMGLAAHGFTPVLAWDCVASRSPADLNCALERARLEGAVPVTAESLLFELTQRAGTDVFKTVSKLVK